MVIISLIILFLMIGAAGWMFWFWNNDPCPPLDPQEWWGPELEGKMDTSVRPFEVKFSEEMIADLKHRLLNTRTPPPPLEGAAFQYGFNSLHLNSWKKYWIETYNFTERERFFNQFQQFKTNVQGLEIHFIWVRPKAQTGVEVLPLLLLHGWPGSVREFYEIIPLLAQQSDKEFVFEVVVPSLPGFGFSDAPVRPGLGGPQTAVVLKNLMERLGHKQFYMQGGDWGGLVAADLATLYPEAVLGFHTNMPAVKHPCAIALTALSVLFPSWIVDPEVVDRTNKLQLYWRAGGYLTLQATKPDTINVALTESPLGLLVYILEKFSSATNPRFEERADEGLLDKFSREQLLDNAMMYWLEGRTAVRLYADGVHEGTKRWRLNIKPTPVPTWVLQAKHEIIYQTPTALRFKYPNLLNVTVMHEGGHFFALEEPEALAEDLFTAVKAFREFHERQKG
ncbi:juvenile hormone epoxide hydrolase-like [Leguminivora glycinivorella]|uniref:juvenile hormone epoxide hydrolase-like n=1 Tax=Leguminivora glycinivorella TaxID=1035111 RepID=UPI00200BEC27|nr:juvenile hormone epoxide hydrolase-like [Leguminivora glycinivorella]